MAEEECRGRVAQWVRWEALGRGEIQAYRGLAIQALQVKEACQERAGEMARRVGQVTGANLAALDFLGGLDQRE